MSRRPRDPDEAETRVIRQEEVVPRRPPPRPPWWRENWWIWLALLGVVVIGGLLVLYVAGRDDDEEAATTDALVTVPRVVGLSEDRAIGRLEGAGLDAEVEREARDDAAGRVFEQDPAPGSRVEEGASVTIRVAQPEPAPETITVTETEPEPDESETEEPDSGTVPDVVGEEHFIAGAAVEQFGLVADTYPVESREPQGTVVAQQPPAGTELARGETVRLNVSLGDGERSDVTVPDITGPEAEDARSTCREEGFTCRTIYRAAPSDEEVGEVLDQRPAAGTVAPLLTQITLFVGR